MDIFIKIQAKSLTAEKNCQKLFLENENARSNYKYCHCYNWMSYKVPIFCLHR